MVETLAEIKEDIAEKDYDSARKKTTETIASLFFSSSTKPTFSTDSPFLRKIASTSDPRELTTLLSSALELVDIYSKLHRYLVSRYCIRRASGILPRTSCCKIRYRINPQNTRDR